jgi:hypothetical protein
MAPNFDPSSSELPDAQVPEDAAHGRVVVGSPVPIYLAVAYRWGETNNHWYYVYAGLDMTKALALAENESNHRGGKYAVCVWQFTPDGCDYKIVGYFASSQEDEGTNEPEHSWYIDYIQRLGHFLHDCASGSTLLPDPEDPKRLTFQSVEIPGYQRKKVEHEQGILQALRGKRKNRQSEGTS